MRIALRSCIPLALVAVACAHSSQLTPAPDARIVPGNPRAAEETVEGVRVAIDSAAWRAGKVYDVLSPVKVTLENKGTHRLRIAYGDFTLGGPSGFRLAALTPSQVAASNASAVQPGAFGRRYVLVPWTSRFGDAGEREGGYPVETGYYGRYYVAAPATLPDRDVLRQALPEGVLEPGGEASGFLYFADQPSGTPLTFTVSLVDADLGQSVGTVSIPLVVK